MPTLTVGQRHRDEIIVLRWCHCAEVALPLPPFPLLPLRTSARCAETSLTVACRRSCCNETFKDANATGQPRWNQHGRLMGRQRCHYDTSYTAACCSKTYNTRQQQQQSQSAKVKNKKTSKGAIQKEPRQKRLDEGAPTAITRASPSITLPSSSLYAREVGVIQNIMMHIIIKSNNQITREIFTKNMAWYQDNNRTNNNV